MGINYRVQFWGSSSKIKNSLKLQKKAVRVIFRFKYTVMKLARNYYFKNKVRYSNASDDDSFKSIIIIKENISNFISINNNLETKKSFLRNKFSGNH